MDVLEDDGHRIVAGEGDRAGQHLVGNDAHGVEVALGGGLVVLDGFGGQVGGCAHEHARRGQGGLGGGAGQAEVGDLHVAAVVDEDVFRLDVAVDDAGSVGGGQAVQDLAQDAQGLLQGIDALPGHVPPQADAVDILHDQVIQPLIDARVVDLDDVGVGDGGRGPGLPAEALLELGPVRPLGQHGVHDLDRHMPGQPLVQGFVDRGHATLRDLTQNAVAPVDDPVAGPLVRFTHARLVRPSAPRRPDRPRHQWKIHVHDTRRWWQAAGSVGRP